MKLRQAHLNKQNDKERTQSWSKSVNQKKQEKWWRKMCRKECAAL